MKEFSQTAWNETLRADWLAILELAIREDIGAAGDCTALALVPEAARGRAAVVVRAAGMLAGEAAVETTCKRFHSDLRWTALLHDGQALAPRQTVGWIEGPAAAMLAVERPLLNLLGRLSGVATLTRRYADLVAGTRASIYDTRKTTPGWRSLEKYAVRCGGGKNHRAGLFEAVLIKDNHLALGTELRPQGRGYSPAEAVVKAREYLAERFGDAGRRMIVEVEVDTLDQLDEVLVVAPDIVLLDNMPLATLGEAVARRDAHAPAVGELEASGGIDLSTVRAVAESGVERISAGALTHSAVALDFGIDWA